MDQADRDDLDALMASKGWGILQQRARKECATRKDRGVTQAADEHSDASALHLLRQVLAFEQGVEFVLKMPAELMASSDRLTMVTMTSPSRRGTL